METAVDAPDMSGASETVVSNVETPAVAEAPSLDSDLQGIWDKHNPPRENGRFVSKNPTATTEESDPVTPELADQAAGTAPEQAKPAIEAPISWSAEQKAKWASLPPDVQTYIAQRDKESHEAITRAGQQIKAFEPIRNVVEQHAEVFRRNGLHPAEGIDRMLNIHDRLEAGPAQAAAVIREIAQAYGVNLSGQAEQDAEPVNPRVAELEARLAKTESYLTAQQRQQVDAEQKALAREIADFAKDKPHFETVRSVMAGLMQSGAAETLADAYEMAVHANPTTRQSILADQQKAAEDKRKAEEAERVKNAKKAAGVNVKSSPGQAPSTRSLDDDLREIARKHYGR